MRRPRMLSMFACVVLAANLIGPASPVAADPGTFEYPGPTCPLDGVVGLQHCIDQAAAGSTIILTQQVNPDTVTVIKRSLTLRANSRSLQPELGRITVLPGIAPDASGMRITIQDVRVSQHIAVMLQAGSGHDIRIRRVSVGRGATSGSEGIVVTAEVPATVTIEDSFSRHHGSQHAIGLFAFDPDGPVTFRVIGNRITNHGTTNSGGGVVLSGQGDGSVRLDVLSNTIWDVGRCVCSAAVGVGILAQGGCGSMPTWSATPSSCRRRWRSTSATS